MLTKNDLSEIRKIVHTETTNIVQNELNPIRKSIRKIQKDIDGIISFFDRQVLNIRKRVEIIEENLGLSPLQ